MNKFTARTNLIAHFRVAVVLLIGPQAIAQAQVNGLWVSGEIGPVWQTRNDVQIPNDTGTRISLKSLGAGAKPSFRAYIGYAWGDVHELRALIAPLALNSTGTLPSATNFQGQLFSSATDTEGYYRFNSYRLSYRYSLIDSNDWNLRVGATGKVRDAEIRLTQGGLSASRSNVGFVPLLHLHVGRQISSSLRVELDIDGAWSPFGRAEDISLLAFKNISEGTSLFGGYRTVEGGSDGGGGVYTFAWLHYLCIGLKHQL